MKIFEHDHFNLIKKFAFFQKKKEIFVQQNIMEIFKP